MFRSHFTTSGGFTLVELMVVISIIGVLSSVVMAPLSIARQEARDTERVLTLREIQRALETYYLDHGEYPNGTAFSKWNNVTGLDDWSHPYNAPGNPAPDRASPMKTLIDSGYIPRVPEDPINVEGGTAGPYLTDGPDFDLSYVYCSGNNHGNCPLEPTTQTYVLGVNLESGGGPNDRFGNYQLHELK